MKIPNTVVRQLVGYWETTQDPLVAKVLDVVYEAKIVVPLQHAFFQKKGWPIQVFLVNGKAMCMYGRAMNA